MHHSSVVAPVTSVGDPASVAWLRLGNAPLLAVPLAGLLLGGAVLTVAALSSAASIGVQTMMLVCGYALAALLVNRAHLSRIDGGVQVSHGPLPVLPRRTVHHAPDAKLVVARDAYTDGRATLLGRMGSPYALELGFADGRHRRRLLANLDREQAMRLRATLDRR